MKILFNIISVLIISCFKLSSLEDLKDSWSGLWFPGKPGWNDEQSPDNVKDRGNVLEVKCDDFNTNLTKDYVPDSSKFSFNYLCLNKRYLYTPNASTEAIIREFNIPPAYEAPKLCMNETIEYNERIPTFGPHRVNWAKYGEYKYLPPQRWLHNIEHGAVVMLYHPCANKKQLDKLKTLVKSCLYRYVITPSQLLQPDRPFAIVTWGKSLEMSVINQKTVVEFITDNALKGPKPVSDGGSYDLDIILEARLVTTISDETLCPQNDIIMR